MPAGQGWVGDDPGYRAAIMDAIEEVLFSEPIDEVLIDVPAHHLASMLHQDLERRLRHHHVTVATIRHEEPGHHGAHAVPR